MKCSKGHENVEGAKFCEICGERLEQKTSRSPLYVIFLVVILIGIAALVVWQKDALFSKRDTTQVVESVDTGLPEQAATDAEIILRLHGSNTVGAKLAPDLAKGFLASLGASTIQVIQTAEVEKIVQGTINGKAQAVEIKAHGSSTGFRSIMDKECDIGMASRPAKEKEVVMLKEAVFGDFTSFACEHVLALDGIAIIVNRSNPVDKLNINTIARMFSGEITNWKDAGGEDLPVRVYSRDDNSGTYETFKKLVLGKTYKLVADARRFESNAKLSDSVSQDPSAIGFTALPYVRQAKALDVFQGESFPLRPSYFTVATEDYLLSRRLFLYTTDNPQNQLTVKFIHFALSEAGQKLVFKNHFIPLGVEREKTAISPNAPTEYRDLLQQAERLSLNFRFRSGSYQLDNKAMRDLERLVDFLRGPDYRDAELILLGFSDNLGAQDKNIKLSVIRARTVFRELLARGIDDAHFAMTVRGLGPALPVASNETADGRRKNRRVEVWVKTRTQG